MNADDLAIDDTAWLPPDLRARVLALRYPKSGPRDMTPVPVRFIWPSLRGDQ